MPMPIEAKPVGGNCHSAAVRLRCVRRERGGVLAEHRAVGDADRAADRGHRGGGRRRAGARDGHGGPVCEGGDRRGHAGGRGVMGTVGTMGTLGTTGRQSHHRRHSPHPFDSENVL